MRPILFLSLLFLPTPILADIIEAASRVTGVIIYPQGAEVTREVRFTAPAGLHDLIITDLPAATAPEFLRLTPGGGLQVGAYSLRTDRLPPREEPLSESQTAARAEVERLEAAERAAQAGIEAINARIEAAATQVAFLRGLKAGDKRLDDTSVAILRDITQMIGQEVLAAKKASRTAKAEVLAAEDDLRDLQDDLAQARAAFAALARPDAFYAALSVAISQAADGAGTLQVRHFVNEATWQPVYELALSRKPAPGLIVSRGVLVAQSSGEDWQGVALTLSTAQPATQAAPSDLWPDLRRIGSVPEPVPMAADSAVSEAFGGGAAAEPGMASRLSAPAIATIEGDVVVYHVGDPANIASGVENLRIALDEIALAPTIEARAVPRYDQTAFMLATFTNTTAEVLLPGTAFLLREGTLVGSVELEAVQPGAEAEVAFGAIDGLQLKRDMPLRAEGDRGIISTSSQIEETATLEVENLTGEAWPVRLIDQVPYSEQEDLEITWSADPVPTEADVDGQRGILAWEFEIAPGETRIVKLTHLLSWPEGMVLQ